MLEARALTLEVPGRRLCQGLDVRFQAGEMWGILGANGAGKTTLLHALAGLRRPEGGAVHLDGEPVLDLPARQRARRLSVLLQDEAEGFWGTALDWVRLGRFPHGRGLTGGGEDEPIVRAALERVGVAHLAQRTMATLSGGERQRVRLAMVLAQQADALLLDEPLQHLDLRSQLALLRLFAGEARRAGRLVIMVLHDVYWVSRYCDRALLVFGDGRVLHGPTGEMLQREPVEALYGCPLLPVEAAGGRLFLPVEGAP